MEYIVLSIASALQAPEVIWVAAIIASSLFVRAAIGFGDGLIAVPLLSFFMDISEAVPLVLFLSSSMSLIAYWRSRQQTQLGSLGRTATAALLGFPLGVVFLTLADAETTKFLLGVMLVLLAVWRLRGQPDAELSNPRWSYIFGLFAGILGSAYAMRGVVFAVYGALRGWSPAQFKSTIHGFYVVSGLMTPPVFIISGLVTQNIIGLYCLLLPVSIVVTLLGSRATEKCDTRQFQRIVWSGLLMLGTLFVLQIIYHWAQ